MLTVEQELKEATKHLRTLKHMSGEHGVEDSKRRILAWKVDSLTDQQWDALSEAAMFWVNEAVLAIKQKRCIPEFPAPATDPFAGYTFAGLLTEDGDQACDSQTLETKSLSSVTTAPGTT